MLMAQVLCLLQSYPDVLALLKNRDETMHILLELNTILK